MRSWIGPLAFWLISCGSSTTDETTTGNSTAAVAENTAYLDFAPQSSTDGQKLAFLSLRDAGAYRVYLYNESADPKLAPLAKTIAIEPATDELITSLSDDGNWILTWRYGTEKNYLLLNSFDLTQQTTLDLETGVRVRDLSLAPSGQPYFAYTERKAGVDSVHIYSFTPGSPVATAAAPVISGEYGAQFAVSGSDVYVFTRKTATDGQVTVQYRKRSASGSWDLQPESLTLSAVDAAVPSAASAFGLIHAKTLATSRLKAKLGTYTTEAENYQKNVGVVQEAQQFQGFSATAVNFSAGDWLKYQPLTVGNISATADGAYVLVTGYDAWFCKTKVQPQNQMVLLNVSTGEALPLIPTRESGTEPWTGLVADPCSHFDQDPAPKAQDFDVSAVNGQILSVTGNRVTVIFESKYTGDREIRRVSFDVSDWAAKTYANVVFTEISANHR
ncbi:hypothetical protein [Oligoflexus tunisiensis]|uniref:hypothetical protein n=1 Tax=Oligoflexus tunisiensis TaxID=708132 RepID=UPI00114C8ED6|nr:hypothetical protein [Oligoflexus tunisiensis]